MTKNERMNKLFQHLRNRIIESEDWANWIDETDAITDVLNDDTTGMSEWTFSDSGELVYE